MDLKRILTGLVKTETVNGKKYMHVGPVRVPYEIEREFEYRKVKVGPVRFSFRNDKDQGRVFLQLPGGELPIPLTKGRRRMAHYNMRSELSREKCQELLETFLPGLLGYEPDLNDPKTFNEKINWLKLHNEDPRITVCCDKYALKEYAREIIGEEHILPVLGVWEKGADIDFGALPDSFALKVNWSSGFNIIVPDKSKLDCEIARKQVDKWMEPQRNSYYDTFNWGYKYMKPVAFAEPYIEQMDGQVYDYKFYYSYGKFLYMFIATERNNKDKSLTYTFYDENFQPLPFTYGHKPNADPVPEMPKNLERMLEAGRRLAEPFPFVRVDFYELNEKEFYLGEMTFYSGGGTLSFDPVEWDRKLGDKISLEKEEQNGLIP